MQVLRYPPCRESPATPPVVHEHFREKHKQDAPRPYPMTKVEAGWPWSL